MIERRERVYTLKYDDGTEPETVTAATPSEAVAARVGAPDSLLPETITDRTAVADWIEGRMAWRREHDDAMVPA